LWDPGSLAHFGTAELYQKSPANPRRLLHAVSIAYALAILREWVKATGAEMNEERLRRIPKGADLIVNKVSGAPGFWIGNVIVMAGVPYVCRTKRR